MPIYLAFDYGEKRIGTAVGDDVMKTARALSALPTGDWPAIAKLIAEWRPGALIVGLPLLDDGNDQAITTATRKFANSLGERTKLPVHFADERFSSRAADDYLRDARASGEMTRRVRKGDRDAQAARVILQQWLDDSRPAN